LTLWAATRRVLVTIGVSAVVVVLVVLLGAITASIPALASARGLALPLALIAPLALSTMVGYSLTTGDPAVESTAVRPIAALDTASVVLAALAVSAALGMLDAAGYAEYGAEAGRNAIGFVGLLLIGRAAVGPNAGTAVPVIIVVLLAFFGADAAGEPRWWAWALVDSAERSSWVVSLVLVAVGGSLELTRPVAQRVFHLVRRLRWPPGR